MVELFLAQQLRKRVKRWGSIGKNATSSEGSLTATGVPYEPQAQRSPLFDRPAVPPPHSKRSWGRTAPRMVTRVASTRSRPVVAK